MTSEQAAGNAFWQYSLKIYSVPAVKGWCLELQEEFGADINLLLFCCWVGKQDQCLVPEQLHNIEQIVLPLRISTILPLRKQRQALVGTSSGDSCLKGALLMQELAAEQKEQLLLYQWWHQNSEQLCREKNALRLNVRNYMGLLNIDVTRLEALPHSVGQAFE